MTVKDIIAQDQAGWSAFKEIFGNDECLRQSVGIWLYGVGERYAPLRAVAKQRFETRLIVRRRDDQDFPNALSSVEPCTIGTVVQR